MHPKQIRRGKVHPDSLEEREDIDCLPGRSDSLQHGKKSLREDDGRNATDGVRFLEVRLRVYTTEHAFLACVRRIGDHAYEVIGVEVKEEVAVERVFFECAGVDDPQAVQGVDAQLVGGQPDDGAMSAVQCVDGEDFVASLADRLDPAAGDWRGKVGIGDFGERGEEKRLNQVSEQREKNSESDGR